jgi:hypothetical protein
VRGGQVLASVADPLGCRGCHSLHPRTMTGATYRRL